MSLLLWGLAIGTVGKLVLGIAVLRVHMGIVHERKIDGAVIRAMKRERYITFVGLMLIVAGYIFEVIFYGGSTPFFECTGSECASLVEAVFE